MLIVCIFKHFNNILYLLIENTIIYFNLNICVITTFMITVNNHCKTNNIIYPYKIICTLNLIIWVHYY